MKLSQFNQTPKQKIAKINSMLSEQFGVSIPQKPMAKEKLDALLENAETAIIKIRGTNKQFQLEPEYAKFLGIKDVIDTMISEGMYAESPKYYEMKEMIMASVCELMDSGYSLEEAVPECMNRFRMDNRFAYDDEHVLPMIQQAAESYYAENSYMQDSSCMEDADEEVRNIKEDVDVQQAEVVMAVRALAEDMQDQIERIGRMQNEDVPAIADQMRTEMGASQAQMFVDSTNQLLSTHLESCKSTKSGIENVVNNLTGGGMAGGLGDTGELGGPDPLAGDDDTLGGDELGDPGLGGDDTIDNIPANMGPVDEPLGRAEI